MTRIAVVGLGKIGLPLAALYASRGHQVTGCDINPEVVAAVNRGVSTVGGEPGLAERVAQAHDASRLSATTDTAAAVAQSDVVVVIVRIGIDQSRQADFSQLDAAARDIGRGLKPGTLVVLESTAPVGVTRGRLGPALADASGLAMSDFRLAYSPERVTSGTLLRDLATYPKVVGGIDAASAEAAAAFYRSVLDTEIIAVPDAETAEFTKLAEGVYRDVNIALANELAMAAEAMGIDYAAAARAANSQPHSHLHAPGVGVGGHCIPVYPYFITIEGAMPRLAAVGREINDSMAAYAVQRLAGTLEGGIGGKTVLVLGLAYRGGVKESTLSSTLLLARELAARGARALVHDPLYSAAEVEAHGLEASELPPARPIDAVVLQAMHPEYGDLDLASLGARVFLDGRGAMERARVEAAGMRYLAIGVPEGEQRMRSG